MRTNAEKLAEVNTALEGIRARIAKVSQIGVPASSLVHEEQRLRAMADWYESVEVDRVAREKLPVA